MPQWDLLLTDANVACLQAGGQPYGAVEDAALAVADGAIAWIGPAGELPRKNARERRSLGGRWLTPALIDCHTHLVFAGDRAAEFEQRRQGATYEEIARAGGGIVSTVNATRRASADDLQAASAVRLAALLREGVATVEIKSGYGLDLETELKMLRVARALGDEFGMTVRTSFLGAHTLPPEYKDRADDYILFVKETVLPAAYAEGLVDAVDAYCERIAFSDAQVAEIFEAARSLELPVKLHADQLSDSGGAKLAGGFGALSADHLEYASESGIAALAGSGTVAVLLPGAFLTLGEKRLPPVQALRKCGVPMAIASDCNPGTSPVCSLQTAMVLASSLFKLTPEECLAGVTREAARALGLADRGTLEVGKRADVAVWNIGHPRELSYWLGLNPLQELLIGGKPAAV
ncbi:MAG TPA: imidazolonepropionase [Woeseiaceae bacterium]|nr:imidazolonepropionase [Woeseiaceae bacterium]